MYQHICTRHNSLLKMDKGRNITLGYKMRVVSQNLLWFIIKDIDTLENARKQELTRINVSNLLTEFGDCHIFGNHKDIIVSLKLIPGNPGTSVLQVKLSEACTLWTIFIYMIPISLYPK